MREKSGFYTFIIGYAVQPIYANRSTSPGFKLRSLGVNLKSEKQQSIALKSNHHDNVTIKITMFAVFHVSISDPLCMDPEPHFAVATSPTNIS